MTFHVLVTAGGTSEKIDDVRVVTNISTGKFGAAIADALVHLNAQVTLLKSKTGASPESSVVNIRTFSSAANLEALIKEELSTGTYHAAVMAAAVADYIPEPVTGKLSSASAEWQIKMRRRGKILPLLRDWIGERGVVVGFKLLSGVSFEELERVATKQMKDCALDLVVANDLRDLTENLHPILLCKPNRASMHISGTRYEVAAILAFEISQAVAKAQGESFESYVVNDSWKKLSEYSSLTEPVRRLVNDLQSERISAGEARCFHSHESVLLRSSALPLNGCLIDLPSDVAEIRTRLLADAYSSRMLRRPVGVDLPDSSRLILYDKQAAEERELSWKMCLLQVPKSAVSISPIFMGVRLVGVLSYLRQDIAVPFILPAYRGNGCGELLVDYMRERHLRIALPEQSSYFPFFFNRAFSVEAELIPGWTVLLAPSEICPAVACASVCLLIPEERKVLLGRRLKEPWQGAYAFPGGKLEVGESPLSGAIREMLEETGVDLSHRNPIFQSEVYVGVDRGRVCYRVTNFVFDIWKKPELQSSDEIECFWFPLDRLPSECKLTPGTMTIARRLLERILHR